MIRPALGFLARLTLGSAVSFALGCAPASSSSSPPEPTAESTAALSVQEAADGTCLTTSVDPLSEQILAQVDCTSPGAFVPVPGRPNVVFTDTVFPYLQQPARDAFLAAADSAPDTSMQVASMLRTVAQQYLLHTWYQKGTCGISLASPPGKSPQEWGVGVDVEEHALWKPAFEAQGFQGSGAPVHFTYAGAGVVDNQGIDVLAFQQLWNLNHPADLIDEDGLYGPQTEARLTQSPAEGFAVGASCAPGTGGAGGATSGTGAGGPGGSAPGSGGGGAGGSTGSGDAGGSTSGAQSGCSYGSTPPGDSSPLHGPGAALLLALAAANARRPKPRRALCSPAAPLGG